MTIENKIEYYTDAIETSSIFEERKLFYEIGSALRNARRKELNEDVILGLEDLMVIYLKKVLQDNKKDINPKLINALEKAKIISMDLGNKFEKNKIDSDFYTQVIDLGKRMVELSYFFDSKSK